MKKMNSSKSNCSNDYPSATILYQELKGDKATTILTAISGVLCLIILSIYIEELWYFINHSQDKRQKKKYMFLLGLYPVISLTSLILLLVPVTTLTAELISSTYLSFAIFMFIQMIIEYFDGVEKLLVSMAGEKLSFGTPPLCCFCRFCLSNIPFTSKSFNLARLLVLQVVFIRPLALLVTLILWMAGEYTPGDESNPAYGVFYSNLINIISSLSSIWGLVILFRATRQKLSGHSIILKFVSLQLTIVFINLQFTILNQLAKADKIHCEGTRGSLLRGIRIHHILLIFEMFFVSILARFAYRNHQKQDISYEYNETPS